LFLESIPSMLEACLSLPWLGLLGFWESLSRANSNCYAIIPMMLLMSLIWAPWFLMVWSILAFYPFSRSVINSYSWLLSCEIAVIESLIRLKSAALCVWCHGRNPWIASFDSTWYKWETISANLERNGREGFLMFNYWNWCKGENQVC
jgi:hypothetical protein